MTALIGFQVVTSRSQGVMRPVGTRELDTKVMGNTRSRPRAWAVSAPLLARPRQALPHDKTPGTYIHADTTPPNLGREAGRTVPHRTGGASAQLIAAR